MQTNNQMHPFQFMQKYLINNHTQIIKMDEEDIQSNYPLPPRISHKNGTRPHSRMTEQQTEEDGGDRIKCSGKSCRSCAAALIADCVALCCCPCAVINFLTFALVKVHGQRFDWKFAREGLVDWRWEQSGMEERERSDCVRYSATGAVEDRRLRQSFFSFLFRKLISVSRIFD